MVSWTFPFVGNGGASLFMSFVRVAEWSEPGGSTRRDGMGGLVGEHTSALLERMRDRRPIAVGASLTLHFLLLWTMIAHIFVGDGDRPAAKRGQPNLVMFDLSGGDAGSEHVSSAASAPATPPPEPAPPTTVDLFEPTAPAEWRIVKIAAQPEQAQATSKPSQSPSAAPDGGAVAGGAGGGGGYDPYAGASPQWRPRAVGGGAAADDRRLASVPDDRQLEAVLTSWTSELLKSLHVAPFRKCRITFEIRADATTTLKQGPEVDCPEKLQRMIATSIARRRIVPQGRSGGSGPRTLTIAISM